MRLPSPILLGSLLAGCGGPGTWTLETWGEDFIEQGIPASVFRDGCAVEFSTFAVLTRTPTLLDDAGAEVAALAGARIDDLVQPGPTTLGSAEVPGGTYRTVVVRVAPEAAATAGTASADVVSAMSAAGASLLVEGTLTCGASAVTFSWPLTTATTYTCDPTNLVVGGGSAGLTQFTVHGDHLFYDSLVDPEAELQGEVYVGADADADGELTVAELQVALVAPSGLDVGGRSDVRTLWDYLLAGSRTVGHVDGEGHCATSED